MRLMNISYAVLFNCTYRVAIQQHIPDDIAGFRCNIKGLTAPGCNHSLFGCNASPSSAFRPYRIRRSRRWQNRQPQLHLCFRTISTCNDKDQHLILY